MQVAGSLVLPSYAIDSQAQQTTRSAPEMRFDILCSAEISGQLDFSKFASLHALCTPRVSIHRMSSNFANQNIGIILFSLIFGIDCAIELVHS